MNLDFEQLDSTTITVWMKCRMTIYFPEIRDGCAVRQNQDAISAFTHQWNDQFGDSLCPVLVS